MAAETSPSPVGAVRSMGTLKGHLVPPTHESLIHFDRCIERLCSALETLRAIRSHGIHHQLAGAAFRFAVVEYAASFTKSYGGSRAEVYKLSKSYVPVRFMDLHERLLASRDQVQAHTDLSILDAKLSLREVDGQRLVTTYFKGISGLEELPNIDEFILLIDGTIKNMLPERNRLKDALQP